jgi:predicted metal-dependent hydrolase
MSAGEQMGLPWMDGATGKEPHSAALVQSPVQPVFVQPEIPVFRHPQAEREVRLGNVIVAYEFQRVRRRSIGMVVSSEGLSVRAPRWVSSGDIETALHAKSRWICNKLVEQRERALKQKASRIEWQNGAVLPYLGEPLRLVLAPGTRGATLSDGGCALMLGLSHDAPSELIGDAFQSWLKKQAKQRFEARVKHFAPLMGVSVSRISLSSARTRWGSASVDGSIRLHWRLMHFADHVIDYVVVHELAHLREMNHSPRFWEVVMATIPDYEKAREQLRHAVIPDWG